LAQEFLLHTKFRAVVDAPLDQQEASKFVQSYMEYRHNREVTKLRKLRRGARAALGVGCWRSGPR
jgi:hypothetical protein